jgi:hypothetical protein
MRADQVRNNMTQRLRRITQRAAFFRTSGHPASALRDRATEDAARWSPTDLPLVQLVERYFSSCSVESEDACPIIHPN